MRLINKTKFQIISTSKFCLALECWNFRYAILPNLAKDLDHSFKKCAICIYNFICLIRLFSSVCMCMPCSYKGQKTASIGSSGTVVGDGCEPPCGLW